MNREKITNLIFAVIVAAVVMVPSLGMLFFGTSDGNSEKRVLAQMPSLITESGVNVSYLSDLGSYFEDHYALREQIVGANAILMAQVFHVSATETVVYGENNWLYYTASLSDFRQDDVIDDWQARALAHNLSLVQEKLERENIDFLFTVAPNKNSLYGENMPYYYSCKTGDGTNIEKVEAYIEEMGIHYADMYEAFAKDGRTLYRKQDSHWNGEGALLAYNTILDYIDKEHDNHGQAARVRIKTEVGDLAQALYGTFAEEEWDTFIDVAQKYEIVNQAESWEDYTVETESATGSERLLMFRDSFGNTLSPLLADAYAYGVFSKASLYTLDSYVAIYKPDIVMLEIVERNLTNYLYYDGESYGPPVMTGPDIDEEEINSMMDAEAEVKVEQCESSPSFGIVTGTFDGIEDAEGVYVEVGGKAYKAYITSDHEGNGSFLLYLPWEDVSDGIEINVFRSVE